MAKTRTLAENEERRDRFIVDALALAVANEHDLDEADIVEAISKAFAMGIAEASSRKEAKAILVQALIDSPNLCLSGCTSYIYAVAGYKWVKHYRRAVRQRDL